MRSRLRAGAACATACTTLGLALLAACAGLVGIPSVTETDGSSADAADADGCGRTLADGAVRAGPLMVRIDSAMGSYCIDTTEVTVSQFNAYLIASGAMVDTPPECDAALPAPLVDQNSSDKDLPVGDLGECHAWSYCRWAGKRLCGTIADGGSIVGVAPPQDTEWVYACINGSLNLAYPYGQNYEAGVCNMDNPDGGPVPVGSKAGCHGTVPPFDRIYDMVGNVQEFTNDLQGNGSAVTARGGYWSTSSAQTNALGGGCLAGAGFNGVIFDFEQSGFRCCADPAP